jgi:hypothetical protein
MLEQSAVMCLAVTIHRHHAEGHRRHNSLKPPPTESTCQSFLVILETEEFPTKESVALALDSLDMFWFPLAAALLCVSSTALS